MTKAADVLIAGGGYVGLSTAVALKSEAPHLHVVLADAAPENAPVSDERASAIAAAASRMLGRLGLWEKMREAAQPIEEMIVTDSRTADPVRPVFLTFGDDPRGDDPRGDDPRAGAEPFAHMVSNKVLIGALREAARERGVEMLHGRMVDSFEDDGAFMHVTFGDGEVRETRLLAACDGVRSTLRRKAGIRTVHVPYEQMGIVCTVAHEREHFGRAEEHFLPAGPFAILPVRAPDGTGTRSSLVWTESKKTAERLMEADEFTFELELERRFGKRLGRLEVVGNRAAYPLGLTLARDFVRPRFALVGDAAHGIHPIAGQGLNLGFKDAAALAQVVVEADRLGQDIGALDVLERYERWRRFDTVQMGVVTDVLNRLFSNDNGLLRTARTVGLGIVDRMPGLKRMFIDQAAGRGPGTPNLLRGEAI